MTEVQWGEHINLITGPNGAGKTNLLDAIHYLCMGRSFASSSDQYVVMQGERSFLIRGIFDGSLRRDFEISCSFERGEGKKLWVNRSPLTRHADLIGLVPVVLVSPADRKLTGEGPAERRAFLDAMIAQTSASYLEDLIRYRKIVRQRNRVLSDWHDRPDRLPHVLEPWDVQLVETGTRITHRRSAVIRSFQKCLEKAHGELAGTELIPFVTYRTFCDPCLEPPEMKQAFFELLRERAPREAERMVTTAGPHRDDLVFRLNDMELRKFGSQGQHRIFALALKMAQLYYYSERLDDRPVFLLDDVFGDLDPQRTNVVMTMLAQHPGQSFVTAAHPDKLTGFTAGKNHRIASFRVDEGRVKVDRIDDPN